MKLQSILTPGRTAVWAFLALATTLPGADEYDLRPFSISLIPPLSSNWTGAASVKSNFSLNIVGGVLGQLSGVELGSVFNTEKDRACGYQGAGAINVVGGEFIGVQQAGIANIAGHGLIGAQFAGAVNVVGDMLTGSQFATVNVAGDGRGAQLGVVNASGDFRGAQLGVVNITDEVQGFQLAVVNISDRMKGFQLGLVNIAGNLHGEALGLVSVVGNGQHHLNLWYDETGLINIGMKLGTRRLYNVFTLGLEPRSDSLRWYTGLGLGGHIPLHRFFLDLDGLVGSERTVPWWEYSAFSLLSRLRCTGGWEITRGVALTAGPTLNLLVSRPGTAPDLPGARIPHYEFRPGANRVRIWPGFTVGLQLL
jgi:hypothetical protein